MPQIFQVLRCYKCSMFQCHQVKKSTKWECKICGEKQSVKRHFGIGTAKDCRLHVQKLNGLRVNIDQYELESNVETSENSDDANANSSSTENASAKNTSKWSYYIDKKDENNETNCENDDDHFNQNIVLELPKKTRKRTKQFDKVNCKKRYKPPTMESQNTSQSWEKHMTVENLNSPSRKSENLFDQNFNSDNLHNKLSNIAVKEVQSVENKKINTDCFRNTLKTSRKISKWGQYLEQENEKDVREDEEEFLNEVVEPNVHNNVGHAQQVLEDSPVGLTNDNKVLNNTEHKPNKMLFSMSDDSDIDDVFNF